LKRVLINDVKLAFLNFSKLHLRNINWKQVFGVFADALLMAKLGDEGGSGGRLVLPGWRQDALGLVVTRQTVDTRLGQNETEFRIAILSVPLEMLSDGDGLLDHVVKVLGDLRGQTLCLQNAENFGSRHEFHLSDSVGISENDTDLGRSEALLRQLVDLLLDILGAQLQPSGK